jgi:hypothetical protein
MKTIIKSIAWPACLALIISLCSFTFQKKTISSQSNYGTSDYSQVREFVYKNICSPLRQADQEKGINMKNFSRCPGGYQSQIITNADSVKVDNDVCGVIKVYRGCAGTYVCDFKVNVSKNTTLVKSKDMQEYVTVAEWLERRQDNKATPEVKQEQPKEVKG